jgi:hypothetical protein
MQRFVIEREVPGAGKMNADELRDLSAGSNKVLTELGPEIQWVESFVTDDKIYCVYLATDEDIVLEHARCGGFPANKVSAVRTVIDPTTGAISA